jgi:hypothetical protein
MSRCNQVMFDAHSDKVSRYRDYYKTTLRRLRIEEIYDAKSLQFHYLSLIKVTIIQSLFCLFMRDLCKGSMTISQQRIKSLYDV